MKMAKSILFKFIFFIFSSHVFMLDLKPYENNYFSKPNGTVKEKLEKNLLRYSSFFIINYVKSVDKIPKNSPAYNKKFVNNKTTVYVCTGTVCSEPISSFEKMEKWIEKNTNLSFK